MPLTTVRVYECPPDALTRLPNAHPRLLQALSGLTQGATDRNLHYPTFDEAWEVARRLSRAGVRCAVQLLDDDTPLPAGEVTERDLEELNHLASQLYDEGRTPEAVKTARRAVRLSARLHGEGSEEHAFHLFALAYLSRYACCYDEAEALYTTALVITERTVGHDHPHHAVGVAGLAALYRETARQQEAERLFLRSLEITAATVGQEHPNYGTTLNDLAGLYRDMGRHADAEAAFERAVAARRRAFGAHHPSYAQSVINFAHLLTDLGQRDRAIDLYREGLAVMRQAYGDTPFVRRVQADLGALQPPAAPEPAPPPPPAHDERFPDQETFDDITALRVLAEAEQDDQLGEAADECYQAGVESGGSGEEYGGQLNLLGELARRRGQLDRAERLLRRCEAILRDRPSWEVVLASCRANLALALTDQGRLSQAEGLYRECVPILDTLLPRPHLGRAAILINQGLLYVKMGRVPEAVPLFERSQEARAEVYGPDHDNVATSLEKFVLLLIEHDPAAALPLARRLLDHRRRTRGERDLLYAQALVHTATILHLLRDHTAAEPLFVRFCALMEDLDPMGEAYLPALIGLGKCREHLERYPEAEQAYQRALDLVASCKGEAHIDTAPLLTRIAQVRFLQGDYAAALPLLERAGDLYAANGRFYDPDHTEAVFLQTAVRLQFGEFGAAVSLAMQLRDMTRAVHGENHVQHAGALCILAEGLRGYGYNRYGARPSKEILAEIEPLYREAIAIYRDNELSEDLAMCYNNLALVHTLWGDQRTALGHAMEAIALRRRLPQSRALANALNVAAGIQEQLNNLKACEDFGREALGLREKILGPDHPDLGPTVYQLARVCYATGRDTEGLAFLRRCIALTDGLLLQVVSIGSERQILDCLRKLQGTTAIFLSAVVHRHLASPEARREALELVLRRKGLAAAALQARGWGEELAAVRGQIARKALERPAGTADAHAEVLHVYELRRQRLERRQAALASDALSRPVSARAVADALPAGAALVEFVNSGFFGYPPGRGPVAVGARYLAFVLHAGQPDGVRLIDLGPAGRLDGLIGAFRDAAALMPVDRATSLEGAGSALRAAVFDPLLDAIDGRTRLLLAADGELSLVPFEALPGPDGRSLIEDYRLSYLGSGRDALRFGAVPGRPLGDALVLADPAFNLTAAAVAGPAAGEGPGSVSRDLDREMRFGPLKHTRQEGERIGAMLGVKPWLRADALEGRLKQVRSPRILHLATHGFFLPNQAQDADEQPSAAEGLSGRLSRIENPLLRSGLALAGANIWLRGGAVPAEAEDGLLTAEDVTGMDLAGTELVVLSACRTGLGDVHVGEGVFGLRRAFVLAGARRLVTSLWKVPDEQTQELMVDFYSRVLAGEGVPEALRGAQLALREKQPDPHYWAAFICLGDPEPPCAAPCGRPS